MRSGLAERPDGPVVGEVPRAIVAQVDIDTVYALEQTIYAHRRMAAGDENAR